MEKFDNTYQQYSTEQQNWKLWSLNIFAFEGPIFLVPHHLYIDPMIVPTLTIGFVTEIIGWTMSSYRQAHLDKEINDLVTKMSHAQKTFAVPQKTTNEKRKLACDWIDHRNKEIIESILKVHYKSKYILENKKIWS